MEPASRDVAFLKELEKHVNKWVAIVDYDTDQERIVAIGDTIREARKNAETMGFTDPTFFRVPPSDHLFVPLLPMHK